jgi:hypothetical protein
MAMVYSVYTALVSLHKPATPMKWKIQILLVLCSPSILFEMIFLKGDLIGFFLLMYEIQHCFICRPTDSTLSEDAGIKIGTVATTALAVRRSNHSARSHPLFEMLVFSSLWNMEGLRQKS